MDSHISKVKALYKGHSASETSNKESENGICQECGNLNGFGDDWKIEKWLNDILEGDDVWSKADSSRNTIKKLPKIKIHSEAVYKSRLLPTVNNELFVKRSIVTHEVIIKRSRESCNELSCNHSQASCDEFRISNNNY
ncbi:20288_t:CDS:2 [Rhizophagus irregularis]|nr:20288_t:CDS:2 [Rhizophagus irregularis]